jgi:hypothetical protein
VALEEDGTGKPSLASERTAPYKQAGLTISSPLLREESVSLPLSFVDEVCMKRLTLLAPYVALGVFAVALAALPQTAGAQATTMPPYGTTTPSANPMATSAATVNPMETATTNPMETVNPLATATATPPLETSTSSSAESSGGHGSWGLLGLLGLIGLIGLRGSSRTP